MNKLKENDKEKYINGLNKFHKLPSNITSIGKICQYLGFQSYIAGGFVRDLILGIDSTDIDIVVVGDAIKVAKLFCQEYNGEIKVFEKFQTATVETSDNFKIDFVSARQEFYERPGALPQVTLGTIKDDLKRRDFTINSMAISLNSEDFGEIIDYFNGQKDLQNRQIRVLYNISFIDDPTRIFRAIRFEQRLGFDIEENTTRYIEEAINNGVFENISFERITRELLFSLKEASRGSIINRFYELGIFNILYPQLSIDKDTIDRLKKVSQTSSDEDIVLISLLILFENTNIEDLKLIFEHIKLSREYKKKITQYIRGKG